MCCGSASPNNYHSLQEIQKMADATATPDKAEEKQEKPTFSPDDVQLEKETFKLKTNNHGEQEITLEYKQFKNYNAAFAFAGGESGALKLLNGVFKNRAKAAGSAPVRLCKAEDDIKAAIAKGMEASRDYEYEERGVGVKKRLENIDKIKADIKSGALKLADLSPEEIAEIMMGL
jgi:hypothetical protein